MKFDASPSLTKGKCVSYSSPKGWAHGGDHPTPKSDAMPAHSDKIVNTGSHSGKFAEGGHSNHMLPGNKVHPAKPL